MTRPTITTGRDLRNHGLRQAANTRTLESLRDFGAVGASAHELLEAMGMQPGTITNMHKRLMRLVTAGSVVRWQFVNRAGKPTRYWAAEFFVEPKDEPADKTAAHVGQVAAHRTGTLGDPWGVGVVPRVVDSTACRPWAMAAARQIESEARG